MNWLTVREKDIFDREEFYFRTGHRLHENERIWIGIEGVTEGNTIVGLSFWYDEVHEISDLLSESVKGKLVDTLL